ncbi:hypothetical protein [Nocardia noduli]|uniref:hypothetical protein n=1 Tax=Nocardia noduli TaxID=2815722 RepID=UPI001C249AED|nr:hypothetical protein [Nocardia noduli]
MHKTTPAIELLSMPARHEANNPRVHEGLLDARGLHLAMAGGRVAGGSPMIEWARELADLHATLLTASMSKLRRPTGFDDAATRRRIEEIVAEIDHWAVFHLPQPVNVPRHTHSLGEVISHAALVHAQSHSVLRRTTSAEHQHEAALRMAQVQEGYADLVTAIHECRVQLPLGWGAIGGATS